MAETLTAPSPSSLPNNHNNHNSHQLSLTPSSSSQSKMPDGEKGKDSPPSRKRSISSVDLTMDSSPPPADGDAGSSSSAKPADTNSTPNPTTTNNKSDTKKDDNSGIATGVDKLTITPPTKKKKLTPAEKEQREKEKAEKDKQKEIEKEKKEKEKAEKEKEKAEKEKQKEKEKTERAEKEKIKQAERDKQKAEKDEKKRLRDEEKRKKDEAIAKKERAQPKIMGFFKKPAQTQPASTRASSVGASSAKDEMETDTVDLTVSASPAKKQKSEKSEKSDYEKCFFEFFVKDNVEMAKTNYFKKDDAAVSIACERLDEYLKHSLSSDEGDEASEGDDEMDIDSGAGSKKRKRFRIPQPLPKGHFTRTLEVPPHKLKRRGIRQKYTTQQILSGLNSSPEPIFESDKSSKPKVDYLALLKGLQVKHLHFAEDIRPPFKGTFTRTPLETTLLRARSTKPNRGPFSKSLPGVNYDYDSEAEWVDAPDEGDGEELLSEDGEDAASDDEGDEMEDFLDDGEEDDATKARRKNTNLGPLVPVCTGLVWEEEQRGADKWEPFRMGLLIENLNAPIDPFSTTYWETPKITTTKPSTTKHSKANANDNKPTVSNALTNMLSIPTAATNGSSNGNGMAPPATKPAPKTDAAKKSKNVARVPAEEMDEFKKEIKKWESLSKLGIVEVLKNQFPKYSKDTIKVTLEDVAARLGNKESEKKWVIIDEDQ